MAKMQVFKTKKGRVLDRPPGTRCYVPGFNDDATQHEIDRQQLGLALPSTSTPWAPTAAPKPALGIAPAVVGAASVASSLISFKKSPRYFGGPLVSTVDRIFRVNVENGAVSAIDALDHERKTAKDKAAWQRVWSELLPTWRINTAQYARAKQLDPSLAIAPPALVTGPIPSQVPPPVVAPPSIAPPSTNQPPFTWGAPPPATSNDKPGVLPMPPESMPGGDAGVTQPPAPTPPALSSMFSGEMGKMLIPGLVLFGVSLLFKKKGR